MKAEGEQLGRKRGSAEIGGSKGGYWGEYDQNIYTRGIIMKPNHYV